MASSTPLGARSTADQVLAGVDLSGKRFLVTGCNSGLGFETMSSLAANGAQVIGLARTLTAAEGACARVAPTCIPVECDQSDLRSVAAAVAAVRALNVPLDALIANAGIANLPELHQLHGIEAQFLVNYISHFALINPLCEQLRSGGGRIVLVSGEAGVRHAPATGIRFDNLDGRQAYDPLVFYGQSKFAVALYAKELSRRLGNRGIAVNAVDPGASRGTGIDRYRGRSWPRSVVKRFMKGASRGAAGQTLLAASPRVAGVSGEYWKNCAIAQGHPLLADADLARRLWETSDRLLAERATQPVSNGLQAAA
jgi:WW domain-containing oxidoreductase